MANCLAWKLVAMALFVAATNAAVIVEEVEEPRDGEAGISYAESALGYFNSKKEQFEAHESKRKGGSVWFRTGPDWDN